MEAAASKAEEFATLYTELKTLEREAYRQGKAKHEEWLAKRLNAMEPLTVEEVSAFYNETPEEIASRLRRKEIRQRMDELAEERSQLPLATNTPAHSTPPDRATPAERA